MKAGMWILFVMIAFCAQETYADQKPASSPPPSCKVGGKHPPCSPLPSSSEGTDANKKRKIKNEKE